MYPSLTDLKGPLRRESVVTLPPAIGFPSRSALQWRKTAFVIRQQLLTYISSTNLVFGRIWRNWEEFLRTEDYSILYQGEMVERHHVCDWFIEM